jgi:hypothetical protein
MIFGRLFEDKHLIAQKEALAEWDKLLIQFEKMIKSAESGKSSCHVWQADALLESSKSVLETSRKTFALQQERLSIARKKLGGFDDSVSTLKDIVVRSEKKLLSGMVLEAGRQYISENSGSKSAAESGALECQYALLELCEKEYKILHDKISNYESENDRNIDDWPNDLDLEKTKIDLKDMRSAMHVFRNMLDNLGKSSDETLITMLDIIYRIQSINDQFDEYKSTNEAVARITREAFKNAGLS